MRIISKFKDYYDSVQSYGYDPSIMYIRKKKEILYETKEYDDIFEYVKKIMDGLHYLRYDFSDMLVFSEICVLLFCNKIYPYIVLTFSDYKYHCYSSEEVEDIIKKFYSKNTVNCYMTSKFGCGVNNKTNVDHFFSYSGKTITNQIDLHFKYNSPIIKISKEKYVEINPVLRYVEFFKIIDTFNTYQEISMFMGGIIGNQKPKVKEIDDKTRLEKHGFNKWSFRKEKE